MNAGQTETGHTVAFQGNPGSYGEIAALNAVPQVLTQELARLNPPTPMAPILMPMSN
jgi:hypothetical protein